MNRIRIIFGVLCLLATSHFVRTQVVINEVFIGDGTANLVNCTNPSSGTAWIELYNPSPCATLDLSCYQISSTNGANNLGSFQMPLGTTIPPLGFLLLGGAEVSGADINLTDYCGTANYCGSSQWQLNNPYGWLALYDETGDVSDALFWTAEVTESGLPFVGPPLDADYSFPVCVPTQCPAANPYLTASELNVGQSEIAVAGVAPTATQSIARDVDDGDWVLADSPTPGNCNDDCITAPSAITAEITNIQNAGCDGTGGSALLNVDNGVLPLNIQWSNGQSSAQSSGLTAGFYTVQVTDALGCETSESVIITQASSLTPVVDDIDPTCFGGNNGSISITNVVGGSGNYSYTWNSLADDTPIVNDLSSGTYQLTINDLDNVGGTSIVYEEDFSGGSNWNIDEVSGSNGAEANSWVESTGEEGQVPPACEDAVATGDATLHITSVFSDILPGAAYAAGLFDVASSKRAYSPAIVTTGFVDMILEFDYIANGEDDDDFCEVVYSTDDGTSWLVLEANLKSPLCAVGGQWTTATYSLPADAENEFDFRIGFNWINDNDNVGSDPSVAINNLIIFTMDNTTCPSVNTITLEEPVAMTLGAFSSATECGVATGSITASATGGDENYTFTIQPTAASNATGQFDNLSSGSYTVEVVDGMGCTANSIAVEVGEVSAVNCDDNDCGTADNWNAATCDCVFSPIPPDVCNDNNSCTDDSWDTDICDCVFVTNVPDDCNDNDDCTTDTLDPATCDCVFTPVVPLDCDDLICENGVESWDVTTCACISGAAPVEPATPQISGATAICGDEMVNYVLENPDPTVTYNWTVDPGIPFTENGNEISVDWSTVIAGFAGGDICLTMLHDCFTIDDFCITVTLGSNIPIPQVSCLETENGSIVFGWDDSMEAEEYSVDYQINGENTVSEITSSTSFQVDGLSMGDILSITVAGQSSGDCGNGANSAIVECEVTSDMVIPDDLWIQVPDAFSPNGDGMNDQFRAFGNFTDIEMKVYNRYGELVFEGSGLDAFWDGTQDGESVRIAAYPYLMLVTWPGQEEPQEYSGNIIVIR